MNFYLNGIFGWFLRMFTVALFAAGDAGLASLDMNNLDLGGGDDDAGDADLGGDQDGDLGGDQDQGDVDDQGQRGDQNQDQNLTPEQRRAAAQESRLGPDVKKLIADLKATKDAKQIKLADRIRTALFSDQAWRTNFPGGIREARQMRQAFDEVGGSEGIQALRDESQSLNDELQTIDQAWETADPKFIEGLAEENPEALSKMAPVILDNWRKVDKDGYNYTTARIFHNTMQSSGVLGVISQLWALAQANKAQPGMAGIIEGLQQIGNWTEGIRELAANQPAVRTDAGLKKLQNERQKFDNDRFTAFKQDVHQTNLRNLEGALGKHLGRFLKAKGMDFAVMRARDPETFKAMLREAESRLTSALTSDRNFQKQKDSLLNSRDRAGVVRLYQRQFEYLLADARGPKIARAVANIFTRGAKPNGGGGNRNTAGGGGATRARNNVGGGQARAGEIAITERPDPSQIDYGRTNSKMIMERTYYLKGKKELHRLRG